MRDHSSYGKSKRLDDLFSEVGEELTAMKKLLSELKRNSRESVVKRGYKTTEVAPGNYSTDHQAYKIMTMEGDDDNDVSTILVDTEQLVSPVIDY